MASSKYLIYWLLLACNTIHFTCSMPSTLEFIPEDPVNLENEDLLKQIFKDIENYTNNTDIIINYLMNIKQSLVSGQVKFVMAANAFENKIKSEEHAFKKEFTGHYNEYECRNYHRHCNDDRDECSSNLLDKSDYIKSIDIFIKLLIIDFTEKLHNFDRQLEEMSLVIGTIKMIAYLKYTEHKLNNTDVIKSKMDNWKYVTFKELDNHQMKLLEKANELISSFKQLSIRETNFEREILEEIKEKKLSYGCCVKKFNFEIEGLECKAPARNLPPPTLPPPPPPPFPDWVILHPAPGSKPSTSNEDSDDY